jgi:plastocyanin
MSARHGGGRRRAVASALCAAALISLAACGSGGTSAGGPTGSSAPAGAASPAGAARSAAVITIKGFGFTTPPSVSPGARVTVQNKDGLEHTVTADDRHAFNSPAPAGTSSFTAPTTPGSYPFHCPIHPEMHGVLVVR